MIIAVVAVAAAPTVDQELPRALQRPRERSLSPVAREVDSPRAGGAYPSVSKTDSLVHVMSRSGRTGTGRRRTA